MTNSDHSAPSNLRRRTLLGLGLAAAGAPWLASCGGSSPTSGPSSAPSSAAPSAAASVSTLRLPGRQVGYPSPFSYGGGVGYIQLSYVYDTLLWKTTDGRQIPWLAEEHTVSGLTQTYQLRRDVTWSDGEPFTADDVVFTFQYLDQQREALAPTVISVPPPGLVTDVVATDEHTVTFTLARPDWTFEQFVGAGGIHIVPEHIWSSIDDPRDASGLETLVGTGPYRITDLDVAAGAYRYEARDDHFAGPPVVQVIEHRPVGDPLAALQAGEIDQAGGVGPGTGLPPRVVEPFAADDAFDVVTAPVGQTVTALYFAIDAGGALADAAFRKACAQAINQEALVEQGLGGGGAAASPGLIPPGHPLHTEVQEYPFDREAAEQALDDAGYPRAGESGTRTGADGQPLSFELLVSTAQPLPIVELVAADLRAVGIEVTTNVVDLPTFGQQRTTGTTQLSINTFGGTATDEQPDGMGKVYSSTSRSLQSAIGYESEEFDRLHALQKGQEDPDQRAETAAQMQQLVAEDLPIIPLVYPPLVTINRAGLLPGWEYTDGGVGGLVPHVNNKVVFLGETS